MQVEFCTAIFVSCNICKPLAYCTSCEAYSAFSMEEISQILRKPNVHYPVHNSLLFVPILSQNNPVHAPPSYFLRSIPISSFHLSLGLPNCSFPQVSTAKSYVYFSSPATLHILRQTHYPRFKYHNNIS